MIRRAVTTDSNAINNLLLQVAQIHHEGRPDVFKKATKKYTDDELIRIIQSDDTPIFVCEEDGKVVGYAFCAYVVHKNEQLLCDMKSLYIDDLCVDEGVRGKKIGSQLLSFVKNFAKENGCYNVTLNVWELNQSAKSFYLSKDFTVLKTVMECIL